MAEPNANSHTTRPNLATLNSTSANLIAASLAPATRQVYRRGFLKFTKFAETLGKHSPLFPISVSTVLLFIAFLHLQGLAASSIQTYVSALSFFNRLLGHANIMQSFVVQKAIAGAQRSNPPKPVRLPIHTALLHKMLDYVTNSKGELYDITLFRAMFLLAFHAFLRIGEITVRNSAQTEYILRLQDCRFQSAGFEITLLHYKGNITRAPFTILIPNAKSKQYCPVEAIKEYLKKRGSSQGPLFINKNGQPVSRSQFSIFLNTTLTAMGEEPSQLKPHSFRIGAATSAATQGVSDDTIQKLGRWKSSAYRRYIKIPKFVSSDSLHKT